jgi:hypothetical protein
LQEQLDSKNSYMHYFKKEDVKEREVLEESARTHFAYDMARGDTQSEYCQKCKYESKWCKHRKEREDFKQKLGATLTT